MSTFFFASQILNNKIAIKLLECGADPFIIDILTGHSSIHNIITINNFELLEYISNNIKNIPDHNLELSVDTVIQKNLSYTNKVILFNCLNKLKYNSKFQENFAEN